MLVRSFLKKSYPWIVLSKVNLVLMVTFTSVIGYALAGLNFALQKIIFLCLGVFGSAVASHIFNQILERKSDALMIRTKNRPLVTGKITVKLALLVGILFLLISSIFLFFVGNIPILLMLLTVFLYVLVYTPLKKISSWNTWIGALPGSLPIFIGFYASASNDQSPNFSVWAAFLILYIWQIPHFLSLAWKYKKDYENAGFKMLVVWDKLGNWTAWISLLHVVALFAVVIVSYIFTKNLPFFLLSFLLTCYFFSLMLGFLCGKRSVYARKIFIFSLFYLPLILLCFILSSVFT